MIQIKPRIQYASICPYCAHPLKARAVVWQGIHICVDAVCLGCKAEIVEDLRVGHALYAPFQVDIKGGKLFGDDGARRWLGEPLLASLQSPAAEQVRLHVERLRQVRSALILNCIDYLYGHALLKLLNAESHVRGADAGLILILPRLLRWMAPEGVAEIWTVDIPLFKAKNYYPSLDEAIKNECRRFEVVHVSRAHSHPRSFDITNFTRVKAHDFAMKDFRITYIWREDRPWWSGNVTLSAARRLACLGILLWWQNYKVRNLFSRIRSHIPHARFTVAGLGVSTRFPAWIDDRRVEDFTDESEKVVCAVYAESRLVIGVHGSNMLLPSAHAGVTIDLMPTDRWSNIAQDVLYQENDSRMAAFRYRYVPQTIAIELLTDIALHCLLGYTDYKTRMLCEVSTTP